MHEKLVNFINKVFAKCHCGFRKGHGTRQWLVRLIEKCKKGFDKGKSFAALLNDFSKASDFFLHKSLTANLKTYGFSLTNTAKNKGLW